MSSAHQGVTIPVKRVGDIGLIITIRAQRDTLTHYPLVRDRMLATDIIADFFDNAFRTIPSSHFCTEAWVNE